MMRMIHMADGEKGGVGKSVVAEVMGQYCIDRNKKFVLVETDRSNADLAHAYPEICEYAIFTENEGQADQADRIFEWAMSSNVIVSLPSQVHRAVKAWIERNQLIELGKEYGVSICKWFVCNGEYKSTSLFVQSVETYKDSIKHILVRNWGLCDDWSAVDEDEEVQSLIKKYEIKVIDFPSLGKRDRYELNKRRMSFGQGREYKEFDVLRRQRIANFLKAAYVAFDGVGVWDE